MENVTAGRDILGDFAPKFAELNDNVLFGQVWAREEQLSPRDRSVVTVTALMASGVLDTSLRAQHRDREEQRHHPRRNGGDPDPRGVLRRMAQGLGGIPLREGDLRRVDFHGFAALNSVLTAKSGFYGLECCITGWFRSGSVGRG